MTYKEAIDYIHSLYWKGKKSGLDKTKELLDLCGHPERELTCIHIAGTNGKGSTAAMLSSICRCAGRKTGLYTSPYIMRYNERVQVDGNDIPDEALARLTTYLAGCVEQMEVPPSEFEFGTVLAFLYFKEQGCDLVILETGLGGTYDSTNVVEHPLLCVITALGLDHTALLGNTIEEIAAAKAGIIKQGVPVVFYGDSPEGEAVIRKRCNECSASLTMPDFKAITSEYMGDVEECQRLSYKAWNNISLGLPGIYQQKNAALVLEVTEVMRSLGLELSEKAVREGLATVKWQARLETVQKKPLLLVDGSHNPQGMQATVDSLKQYFPDRKLQFVFGAMADKELDVMIELFLPLAKKIVITAPSMPRAMEPEALYALCEEKCKGRYEVELQLCPKVTDAVQYVKKEKADEVIVAIGSLYLVGEIKQVLA